MESLIFFLFASLFVLVVALATGELSRDERELLESMVSNNLVTRLKNAYAISTRSRYG